MINGVNTNSYSAQVSYKYEKTVKTESTSQTGGAEAGVVLDIGGSDAQSAVYGKPSGKINAEEINRLWEQTERATESLRNLVERLIARQGKKLEDVLSGREVLVVDSEARAEAEKMISEDGEWGVKAVSSRIVDFAKAISGGDKSKLDELRGAIEEGFKQAEKAFGGELPEISRKTYDEVMKQLGDWEKEE